MANTTPSLLGYQTTYEIKLFDLATNSQQNSDYVMACFWARQHAIFVGCDSEKLPIKPVGAKNTGEALEKYQTYFAELMGASLENVAAKVEKIRSIYGKKGDIPTIQKGKMVEIEA